MRPRVDGRDEARVINRMDADRLGWAGGGAIAAVLLFAGRKGRKDAVPFGPFLALGGATALLIDPPDFLGL